MPAELRQIGPAGRQTVATEAYLRRTVLPLARAWRLSPRGIRALRRVTTPPNRVPLVRGTTWSPQTLGGRPGEHVVAARARHATGRAILYLHGGGYVFGSPRTHRTLTSQISHATATPVFAQDYRLCPEHHIDAGLEDAMRAYEELTAQGNRVVVAGDSAGGGLTLRLALHLVEQDKPAPAGLVTFSPWADLTLTGDSYRENAALDPFIAPIALARYAHHAGKNSDRASWRVSPVFAPDELLAKLPPLLTQAGSTEILLSDSLRFADRLAGNGGRAIVDVCDRSGHVPPLYGDANARACLKAVGDFVADVLPEHAAPVPPSATDAAVATEEVA